MTEGDVENIERATVAAVSPEAVVELDGWLLPFDSGTIGRATSAVPLRHRAVAPSSIREIESLYQARGLPAVFRLATHVCFDTARQELGRLGYKAQRPTQVQVAAAQNVCQVSDQSPAQLAGAPDEAWAALFLGEGFDPVDGANRVRALSRAEGSLYASVRDGGQTVAAGAAAFSHGWASVHGMRTAQACRGRGLAGRVLAGIAHAAMQKGIEQMFLQVEEGNLAARALYLRAGFRPAWTYEYWRKT